MEFLMPSAMSATYNLTKFLWSTILEKEALDQPISAYLLNTSYQTWFQDFPFLHKRKVTLF